MKFFLFYLLIFLLYFQISQAQHQNVYTRPSKKKCFEEDFKIDISHRDGSGIGYNKGYTSLHFFYIPRSKQITPFTDLRVHMFNDGRIASNVGLGVRALFCSKYILGINGYYDYRSAKKLNSYQYGMGLEFLSKTFELFLNGYVPFGKKRFDFDRTFNRFEGNELIVSQNRKTSLAHLDFLARYRMYKNCDSNITTGIGGYYLFKRSDSERRMGTAFGVKGQIKAQLLRYLVLGFDLSYDKIFKMRYEGSVGLSIPLSIKKRKSSKCKSKYAHCFLQRSVERDEIIPIENKNLEYPLVNPLTSMPYNFIFVNNDNGSNGTFEDPFTTVTDGINAASTYSIVYVFPGSTEYSNEIIMKDKLRLQGSGHSFTLQDITIPAFTANVPFLNPKGLPDVTLANDNIINGFKIDDGISPGSINIRGDDIANVTIQNCEIDSGSPLLPHIALFDVDGIIKILDCSGNVGSFPGIIGVSIGVNNSAKIDIERNNFIRRLNLFGNSPDNTCLRFRNNNFVNGYNLVNLTVESPDGTQAGVEAINQGPGTFTNVVFTENDCP